MSAAATLDETFRAVADETRRSILRLVRDHEVAAGDIARQFGGISRPAVSQHLRTLIDAGLVEVRRDGRRRLYRQRSGELEQAAEALADLWPRRLERLRDVAEAAEAAERSMDDPR
jgi:DNA-binding transcriptional ArsR family regulator